VGLLLTTCGFLIVVLLTNSRHAVELLKRDYLQEVVESTAREVSQVTRDAQQVLRAQQVRIATGVYATSDPLVLAKALATALQAVSSLEWASYGEAASGRFAGANRLSTGELILNVSDPREARGLPREFNAATLTPYVRMPPPKPYDPRTREWFRRAVEHKGAIVWMPPYEFAEGGMGITCAAAVVDDAGQIRGVVTTDTTLRGIAEYLQKIKVAEHGIAVIVEPSGRILAGGAGTGRDAAQRAVEAWTRGRSSLATPGSEIRSADIHVRQAVWNVVMRRFAPGPGLDWHLVVAVPEDDFMGPIHANRRAAIAIAIAGLLIAVAAGFLLASGIARSLARATHDLDRLAQFDMEGTTPPTSMLAEIARLQGAVNRVKASLRSFSRYAPEEIVRDVVVSGREAMLSGEQREVSVLFSDLRGFTAFAERMAPERVVAILNDHFDLQVAIIARYGGFVVDFLGDCVFAVFGAPAADSGHVERAVACGIEMQRARLTRNDENRARGWPPLEMGVGVNTGPAVVGNMGSRRRIKYGVVGHVVNVAARVETFTVGGQVLATEATRNALGERLVAEGPIEVEGKGVGAAVRVWDVHGLAGTTPYELPAPDSELTPLAAPLEARLRLLTGKAVDAQAHPARLLRLGAAGAELTADVPLALFGGLQLLVPRDDGALEELDAKVVRAAKTSGGPTVVRFTGLDWDTRARLEALAHPEAA
jgi:adenylate cyclase